MEERVTVTMIDGGPIITCKMFLSDVIETWEARINGDMNASIPFEQFWGDAILVDGSRQQCRAWITKLMTTGCVFGHTDEWCWVIAYDANVAKKTLAALMKRVGVTEAIPC